MGAIKIEHLPDTREFETDNKVNINKRLQDGRTKLFKNRVESELQARNQNSYSYPVYENGKFTGFYAVPE